MEAADRTKRLEICTTWGAEIGDGSLDPEQIYWADEKISRLGARQ